MAKPNSTPITKAAVKQIFDTMDYGTITDNTSSAEAWLRDLGTIAAYKNGSISRGKSFDVKDVNGVTLLQVISPLPDHVEELVVADTSDWENKENNILMYRLSNELEKNSSLICQLEIVVRDILGKYTKTALSLLIEYLRFYSSHALASTNQDKIKGVSLCILSDDLFLSAFGCILGPALSVGCDVILQTEPKISVIATFIKHMAKKVGFPENSIRILPGIINLTHILKNENIGIVSCFGNVQEDKFKDVECLSKTPLIAVSKTRGPMIIFNNADLDSASNAVIDAAWGFATVLPWSLNTVLVQEDVYHTFVSKLRSQLMKVRVGSAYDKLSDVSCVPESEILKIEKTVNEAKLLGLEVIQNSPQTAMVLKGDVLNNVVEDSDLPVVTVVAFRNTTEAIILANSIKGNMGVSVWTENIGLANEVVRKLQFSNIWINSFGKFSALHSICLCKNSGLGYIGGVEGGREFYESHRIEEDLTFIKTTPTSYSYEIDGIYGKLVGKDVSSAVAAAKKGHEVWQKKTIYERFQMLIKLSSEIECNKEFISEKTGVPCNLLDHWIRTTYKSYSQFSNIGQAEHNEFGDIKTFREPVGIIVIEASNHIRNNFDCIIGSLLLGNSVILLNFCQTLINFYAEICRLLTIVKFPVGVVSVVINCEDNIFDNLVCTKELNTFIYVTRQPKNKKICDVKRMCCNLNFSSLLLYVTKTKNVWTNIGHSIL